VKAAPHDPRRFGLGGRWAMSERTACHLASQALTYFFHKSSRRNWRQAYATRRVVCHSPIARAIEKNIESRGERRRTSFFLESADQNKTFTELSLKSDLVEA